MAKILWDDNYLRSFVKELMKPANPIQFWEFDENDEVMEYKDSHFRKLVSSFLPALGVWNLNMGDTEDGNACRYLIFLRDSRSQIINPEALRTILNKVWMFMGSLGDDVKEKFVRTGSKGNPLFTKNFLLNVPELYEKKPLTDTSTSAYRFFQNGWLEITKKGVSHDRQNGEFRSGAGEEAHGSESVSIDDVPVCVPCFRVDADEAGPRTGQHAGAADE